MVNSGYGLIECKQCNRGCVVKTAVNRNKSLETDVIKNKCEHFEMKISIYTNSNYLAWITGARDRISFNLYAKCLRCNKMLKSESTKEGFDTGSDSINETCCGNKVTFKYEYSQSIFDENIISVLRTLPFGNAIPGNLVERLENNLEAKSF